MTSQRNEQSLRWVRRCALYVLGAHLIRLTASALIAYPFAALASRTLGSWPKGDALAFDPGGLMFAEVLRLHRPALWTIAEQSALLGIATIPIGVVLVTVVMSALASSDRRPRHVLANAVGHVKAFALLYGVYVLGVLAVGFLTYAMWQAVGVWLHKLAGARAGDIIGMLVPGGGFLVIVALTVLQDLARAAVVCRDADVLSAVVQAWKDALRRPARVFFAFTARGSAAVFLALGALHLGLLIGVSTAARAVTVALLNQAALLLIAILRAWWLARAIGLSEESEEGRLAEERGVDLVISASGAVPAEVEVHDPSTEPGPAV